MKSVIHAPGIVPGPLPRGMAQRMAGFVKSGKMLKMDFALLAVLIAAIPEPEVAPKPDPSFGLGRLIVSQA
jgi:hypothetical protein